MDDHITKPPRPIQSGHPTTSRCNEYVQVMIMVITREETVCSIGPVSRTGCVIHVHWLNRTNNPCELKKQKRNELLSYGH